MAKDRERAVNPAVAQRKAEKQKALKKGKAAVQAQRNERLAHRNPQRLQRQIEDLKALEASSGQLSARDKKLLEELERDVARVRKAKELVGDKLQDRRPTRDNEGRERGKRSGQEGSVLGKRSRVQERESDGSETDESVRNIPMPRDTPPPIPSSVRRQGDQTRHVARDANATPLGQGRGGGERMPHALPEKPAEPIKMQAQVVYEAKPAVRDLRKEAVGRFAPRIVMNKLEAKKGGVGGRLLEEDEVEQLEREGYGAKRVIGEQRAMLSTGKSGDRGIEQDEVDEMEGVLKEEEERFRRELRHVEIEEVQDEDI